MTTTLAIAVVSYERGWVTERLLDSIQALGMPYHIFIADNGSTSSETLGRLERWRARTDTTLIRLSANAGPSAGRNAILAGLGPEFSVVAFLDNDIVLLDGWVTGALEALGSGFDAVQPKLLKPDRQTVDRGPTRSWPEPFLVHPEYLGRGVARSDAMVSSRIEVPVFGGTAVVSREVLNRTGGFDERLWLAEDYDLAYRAAAAGFRFCYEPRCEMVHDHPHIPDYENERARPSRALEAHLVFWEKHQKLLLPPGALWLFRKITSAGEPMYLPKNGHPSAVLRRLRRRAWNGYARRVLGETWRSEGEGEKQIRELREFRSRRAGNALHVDCRVADPGSRGAPRSASGGSPRTASTED